eukprot:m.1067292 g.1067292  ORF g.1067292 m.1067292 type:complete len:89 (-) comp24221_c0_seq13:78-344(-)
MSLACCMLPSVGSVAVDQFADNPAAEVWAHKLFAMLLAGKSKLEKKYPMDDLQAMRNVDPLKVHACAEAPAVVMHRLVAATGLRHECL